MKTFSKLVLVGAAVAALAIAGLSFAATGAISANAGEHFAWNDVVGWVDFGNGTVTVTDTKLTGYTSDAPPGSTYGSIGLDCATTPNGNVCGGPAGNWWVANDGAGNLSGWAWSDAVGWISFCGNASSGSGATGGCPASPSYQVKVDPVSGDFSGWAWNDAIGWISFNCNNVGIGNQCSSSNYKVKTSWTNGPPPPNGGGPGGMDSGSWLVSSVFDTQVTGGAAFNTVSWRGALNGGRVAFQIATSNSNNGPWTYLGPDGTANTVYEPPQDTQVKISRKYHNNFRYVRYKVWLNWAGSQSPHVDDVIISYSP